MDYIKESFGKKMNIQYGILFNKIKFNLDSDLSELEKVIISKEIIKQYINQGIIGQYFNPNPGKNRGIRLTKSKEKYIDLGNGQYFEIKRKTN